MAIRRATHRDVGQLLVLETERPNDAVQQLYACHGWTQDDSIWMSRELS